MHFSLLVFERGSLGPSTVTLMALLYDATCGGLVDTVIVNVKLLPVKKMKILLVCFFLCIIVKKKYHSSLSHKNVFFF